MFSCIVTQVINDIKQVTLGQRCADLLTKPFSAEMNHITMLNMVKLR
jgi:hypothetical protein